MPSIAWPRPTLAQPSRNRRAELQHPTPHRFIGDVEPALGEQFLHVAVAQREAQIEPDRVLDDLGRKTMAAIAERSHAATLTLRAALARPVSVTKPLRRLRLTALADRLPPSRGAQRDFSGPQGVSVLSAFRPGHAIHSRAPKRSRCSVYHRSPGRASCAAYRQRHR